MAEAVVNFVLSKLAKIIDNEMELLGGVGKKVEHVQRELTRIKCCLEDAYSKRKGDKKVQNWLNELRDVAYRIEDATDTFFLQVEDNHEKDPSFLRKLKKLCHKPMEVPILHKLANELDDIQNVLEEISKSRVEYGIEPLQDKSKGEAVKMPLRRATYQEVDETEVVGLQADKNNILKLLLPEETHRRAVITIVGTGGLGKTTLAHMVYKSARAAFKYHKMLQVSQQFSIPDLLRKMLKYSVPDNQDVGDLISELKSFLKRKRYLIILDDVWSVDLWNELKDAFPDVNNGSRILITSRFIEVARSADPDMKPYELHLLDATESEYLLLKKALRGKKHYEDCPQDQSHMGLEAGTCHILVCSTFKIQPHPITLPGSTPVCPEDLRLVAGELSMRCNGLPLALIVLGGILSTKEQSHHAWNRVLQTLDWHSEGKDCMQVLAMSYEDMPYYLKACFLYLACFPEDYEISAKRLIRMWVAEGFIPHDNRRTIEQMAEDCLEELFQRSMVQVSSRSMNGSIKCFQVHDLLRDLAIHEARQENFVTVFSQGSDIHNINRGIRRASLQSKQWNQQFMDHVGPNTRSLLLFSMPSTHSSYFNKWSNFSLLRVLELVGVRNLPGDNNAELTELIHLKYMGVRNCELDICRGYLRRMKNLETLDVRGTSLGNKEENELWAIPTLRHVLGDDLVGPISTADLGNLQTMRWVWAHETWERNLPLLNNLCDLGLRKFYYDSVTWVTVTNLLKTLSSLVTLAIDGHSIPMEIVYPRVLPNYQNLQSLYLKGVWSRTVTLEASLFPPHLVKLTLIDSKFEKNPMPELGKLKSLKKLRLKRNVLNYWGPTICPPGFPVLQFLEVADWLIKDLTVVKGGMPKLRFLGARHDLKLHLPPELQHVTINLMNDYA